MRVESGGSQDEKFFTTKDESIHFQVRNHWFLCLIYFCQKSKKSNEQAIALFGLIIYSGSALGIGFTIAAAILAISALAGSCMLYGLLGVNTRNQENMSY